MNKSEIIQRLMATFLQELEEHVRAFNQDLLALEKAPAAAEKAERFKTLFRTAHSLKGAARSVNVPLLESTCHELEEILTRLRDGRMALDAEVFALLFATVDAVEEAGMRLREQQDLTGAPLATLLPRLQTLAGGHAPAPAPLAAPVAETTVEPASSAATTVRVPAAKLDTLLERVGELLVAKRRIEANARELRTLQDYVAQWKSEWKRVEPLLAREGAANGSNLLTKGSAQAAPRRAGLVLRQAGDRLRWLDKALDRLASAMSGDCRSLDQAIQPVDDEVRRVRMLPFAQACAGLDRMARDLAQAHAKDVSLTIEGGAVEMDRSILDWLKDPLRHLVRNAIDHGVEEPAQRSAAGKPRRAAVTVSAALRGGQVEVKIQDDGRGLDLEAIRAQAQRRRLDVPADERELARLIFLPGFSTASIITDVSGRGVGLDVVKSRVESLHGTVDLAFTPGRGTCFTLTVPLTLTTLRAVLVSAGGQTYAFAATNVHKMGHVSTADIRTVAGADVLNFGQTPLPLASLTATLNPGAAVEAPQGHVPVLVVAAGTSRMAFVVDELLTEQEIVIKGLGARIRRLPLVAGATLLASGRIALVLNAANLVRRVLRKGTTLGRRSGERKPAAPAKKRLLVVEDSMTTRTLMKSILEAAGYEVAAAADGRAGWQYLAEHEVDLVVSDVDMPNLDGFDLTALVRGSPKLRGLPVVLVTARETDSDKARGVEVGANAYLLKSAFEQRNLLETIGQLL